MEKRNVVNRGKRDHGKTGDKNPSKTKATAKAGSKKDRTEKTGEVKTSQAKQISTKEPRETWNDHGEPKTKDSPDGKVRDAFRRDRRKTRLIVQLCLGDRQRLQVRPGIERSEKENQEEVREARKVEAQVRRAMMPAEVKKVRRACFRWIGGIKSLNTGRIFE